MEKYCINQAATEKVASILAEHAEPGDLFALTGDLGAGKSTFARAFIRAALQDLEIEVPSPTFTLVQTYDVPAKGAGSLLSVIHTDLYRLKDPDDVYDLGLDDERAQSVLLVEWPNRMPEDWWEGALEISLKRPEDTPRGEDEARLLVFKGNMMRWQQLLSEEELIQRLGETL